MSLTWVGFVASKPVPKLGGANLFSLMSCHMCLVCFVLGPPRCWYVFRVWYVVGLAYSTTSRNRNRVNVFYYSSKGWSSEDSGREGEGVYYSVQETTMNRNQDDILVCGSISFLNLFLMRSQKIPVNIGTLLLALKMLIPIPRRRTSYCIHTICDLHFKF